MKPDLKVVSEGRKDRTWLKMMNTTRREEASGWGETEQR